MTTCFFWDWLGQWFRLIGQFQRSFGRFGAAQIPRGTAVRLCSRKRMTAGMAHGI